MASDGSSEGARDPVLWLGLASCAGPLAIVAPYVALATAGLVGLLLSRRCGGIVALLSAIALVAGFARGRAALGAYEAERAELLARGPWPERCLVGGVVSGSPALVGGALRVEVGAATLRCRDGPALRARRLLLYVPEDIAPSVGRGDAVSAIASLAPPYRFWNDGTGDPRPVAARRGALLSGSADDLAITERGRGVSWWIDRTRAVVRARILATFPPETAAMARALMLGEDDLDAEDQRAFRRSGLAHLLAVSGMHLVLVVMGFVAALRALLVRASTIARAIDVGRVAAAIGLPVAWLYCDLAGSSGSAVRAAWMCSVVLLARALARRASPWRALALSIACMTVLDPLVVFDVSFVLSALATLGLLGLARPVDAAIAQRAPWLPGVVRAPLATTIAATVACAPVLATMAPELPLGGLLANILAVPLGEAAALPLCLLHALVSLWPAAENGCAIAASGALTLVRALARSFTWGTLPVPSPTAAELAVIATATAVAAMGGRRLRLVWLAGGALGFVGLEALTIRRGVPHGELRVTFLDVGQGDATLIDLPDGSAMLVDGGGLVGSPLDVGERVLLPVLAARRRRSLDVAVLSHPHPDHYGGLASTLARYPPATLWDTGQGEREAVAGAYASLLADLRRRGVTIGRPAQLCGTHTIGGAEVDVLAPCPDITDDRGANDNSFVIRVRFGERAVLLVGDTEHTEERELLARAGGQLAADVLKVGHHGSRTSSTPAFLAAVAPKVAVVSCGVRNRYGHPHASTLASLVRAGARVLRTDRDGSVVVTTDGRSLDVRTMSGASPR